MKTSWALLLVGLGIFTADAVNAQAVPIYTVTFDLGDKGVLICGDVVQKIPEGGTAIAPEISVDAGSTFVGWDKHYHNVVEDVIVSAQYVDDSSASIVEREVVTIDKLTYEFGYSSSVGGDTVLIGATGDNENGSASGCAYVFVRDRENWVQQAKLIAGDGAKSDYFGESVDLSGDTAVIGASGDNRATGSVYVFTRSGTSWGEQAKLVAGDGKRNDRFGISVSVSGNTAVVGTLSSGSAYVFVRNKDRWIKQAKLVANYGWADDKFGSSVSISGDTIVVGASGDDGSSGSAYVFTRNGTDWFEQEKLTASDGKVNDRFGVSVDISGDTVLVGASGYNDSSGSAYVFVRQGNSWTQQAKLTASDGTGGVLHYDKTDKQFTGSDKFGYRLSLSGDTAVIGAWGSGSAYVFTRNRDTWSEQTKLVSNDGAQSSYFSSSLSVGGDTAVVIDHSKSLGNRLGRAYFYDLATPVVASLQANRNVVPAKVPEPIEIEGPRKQSGQAYLNETVISQEASSKTRRKNTSSRTFKRSERIHQRTEKPRRTVEEPRVTVEEPRVTVEEPRVTVEEPRVTVEEPRVTTQPEPVDKRVETKAATDRQTTSLAAQELATEVLVLEDYDGGGVDGVDKGPYGEGAVERKTQSPGNAALELVDDTNHFGLIQIKDLTVEQDISGYDRLEFWYYSEAADRQRTLQIQLGFANSVDSSAENLWNWKLPVSFAAGHKQWTKASVTLKEANFERASRRVVGNEFDLTRLNRIAVLILRNEASDIASPVYVDNIVVSKAVSGGKAVPRMPEPVAEPLEVSTPRYAEKKAVADTAVSKAVQTIAKNSLLVLEDYDGNGVGGTYKGPFGEGIIEWATRPDGGKALKLIDDASYFGLILIKNVTVEQDISGYDRLEFSYYSEAVDHQRTLQIQLSFTNFLDSEAENLWNWKVPVSLAAGPNQWTRASISLKEANFERISERIAGNEFDLARLNRIAILILRNGALDTASPVYVDDIVVSNTIQDLK